ncbi:MAG: hypothetical protein ABJA67_08760 [Chthonomonadales bacterium]
MQVPQCANINWTYTTIVGWKSSSQRQLEVFCHYIGYDATYTAVHDWNIAISRIDINHETTDNHLIYASYGDWHMIIGCDLAGIVEQETDFEFDNPLYVWSVGKTSDDYVFSVLDNRYLFIAPVVIKGKLAVSGWHRYLPTETGLKCIFKAPKLTPFHRIYEFLKMLLGDPSSIVNLLQRIYDGIMLRRVKLPVTIDVSELKIDPLPTVSIHTEIYQTLQSIGFPGELWPNPIMEPTLVQLHDR